MHDYTFFIPMCVKIHFFGQILMQSNCRAEKFIPGAERQRESYMIKGAQKQMIVVRTAASRYFDEAYFVLRHGVGSDRSHEPDLLTEAQRSKFIRTVGKPGYSYGYGVRTLVSKEIGQSLSPLGEFGWDGMGGCYTLIDHQNQIGIYFAMHVVGCNYAYSHIHPTLRNLTYLALDK